MRKRHEEEIFNILNYYLGDNAPTPVDPVPYGRLRGV
jgi:hypothetical protein